MPRRASLRLQSKTAASDEVTRLDAPTPQPPPPPKAASRRKRVVLNRPKTVADHSKSFEDDIRMGVKRGVVEPEALADLTFPPLSSPPAKKPRRGRPRKSVRSKDESLVILIDEKRPAEHPTAARGPRAGRRQRLRNDKETNMGAEAAQRHSPKPVNPDAQPASSKNKSNTAKRKSSLQRPTPKELRPSRTVDVNDYDFPDDDEEEEEASAARENEHMSSILSGKGARGTGESQDHYDEDGGQAQQSDDNEGYERYEEQEPDDIPEEEVIVDDGYTSSSASDETAACEAVELPFGPDNPQDHHYVKVYCGSLQTAFLQMGKEFWAGGGDGWRSTWKSGVNFDSTQKLAAALKKLHSQLGQAPVHPDVAKQDEYLRQHAKSLELQIAVINMMVTDLCGSLPKQNNARAVAEDVTKSIVPAAIVVLQQVFVMSGMSTQLVLNNRRCAYMSPTTVAIANHVIGWLKALTDTVVRRVPLARDAGMKDIRAQISREALVDCLEQVRKGKGGLAASEAKFEEIAEAARVEQECQEAEAAVRREAASHDATIKRNRQMEAQARYATSDDQYMAFCRSTQNLGPDPLWEHRRRKMQASMRAFRVAGMGYGVSRQPGASVKALRTEAQKSAHRLDARPPVLEERCEPSEEEKKVILEHVVKNRRFDVDAVARQLGWAPGHVRKWRDILVVRARKAYQARGYSVSRLPKWLT
ncbi:hypothetical protein PpBr36_04769 [Pyricularia pennisetigena]|uniref:hypothetical protein n=1 Tax=Pyricularia pennisetigena TaxID=1578925 RepID=UPI001153A87A|nr:hypothetical protein PpBr36_04769 [Pyricularia pennisetigena]TLS26385.1 hypothetical protein PpBr36_04769 [Pyricularia pennisetigena]